MSWGGEVSSSSKVLVADADLSARSLVTDLLARAEYSVVVADDGEQAMASGLRERPALAVLDVSLPGLSGYEVCRGLKEALGEELSVFLISGTRTEPYDRAAGLLIGADDYITRPYDEGEFLARIRRSIGRASVIRQTVVGGTSARMGLSPREREVLALLSHGLDTSAIADRLVISRKTVATHIQRILSKLGVHSRTAAVVRAHREGLVLDVEAHRRMDA
jgi:DNA-binding NarL/FixJ family response regulator